MSIVFVGTPEFAVPSLRRLAGAGYDIALVLTQPDRGAGRGRRTRPPPIKLAAEELGLTVLQPPGLRDAEVLQVVAKIKPEVIVAVAYGQILRQPFLEIAPRGVLNVHPSLLPKYRGASPISAAILAGDQMTGVTIMLMDAGMDSGPILAQERHAIWDNDTAGTLGQRLSAAGADLLIATLPGWLGGEITPRPQDDPQATFTKLLEKHDGLIDWGHAAEQVSRQVRAYNPWPGAFTHIDGDLLQIWQASAVSGTTGEAPGVIVQGPEHAFAVQTGDGLLLPLEVQRQGRKRLPAGEFLRGAPGLLGKRLA
jgi:methionyl-tRNA formyltransferase